MNQAVIVDVVRTGSGRGKKGGALADVHPADVLAQVLRALVSRTGIDAEVIDDVLCGCVTQSGEQALNIGRTALLAADFPSSIPATTIDRQCGSSQQAAHFAAQSVMAGVQDVVIACGVESMSRAPMFSNVGSEAPLGPLARRYPDGLVQQGVSAELLAAHWGLQRDELDAFAARSHGLAAAAADRGDVAGQIIPITRPDGTVHDTDETVRPGTSSESLAGLRPAFQDEGASARFPQIEWQVTAGNSSPLTDGGSAALIMSEQRADDLGLRPRARFHAFSVVGSDPLMMLDGVVPATREVLKRGDLDLADIDVFEVNEAFAPVPLLWQRALDADPERLNPNGGAIALGHALGASGTRILATLVNELEASGGRFGLQTMCEGGGMANAMVIERLG